MNKRRYIVDRIAMRTVFALGFFVFFVALQVLFWAAHIFPHRHMPFRHFFIMALFIASAASFAYWLEESLRAWAQARLRRRLHQRGADKEVEP